MSRIGKLPISIPAGITVEVNGLVVTVKRVQEEYKNGKTNMFDYFVGQTMKKTRGQANPVKVKEILTNELANR